MQATGSALLTSIWNHFFLSHNYTAKDEVRSAITLSYKPIEGPL